MLCILHCQCSFIGSSTQTLTNSDRSLPDENCKASDESNVVSLTKYQMKIVAHLMNLMWSALQNIINMY